MDHSSYQIQLKVANLPQRFSCLDPQLTAANSETSAETEDLNWIQSDTQIHVYLGRSF